MSHTLGSLTLAFALVPALVPAWAPAAGQAPAHSVAPAPDVYKNESVVLERSEMTYKMHADGTGERDEAIFLDRSASAAFK
jgi:hypothetical protein